MSLTNEMTFEILQDIIINVKGLPLAGLGLYLELHINKAKDRLLAIQRELQQKRIFNLSEILDSDLSNAEKCDEVQILLSVFFYDNIMDQDLNLILVDLRLNKNIEEVVPYIRHYLAIKGFTVYCTKETKDNT